MSLVALYITLLPKYQKSLKNIVVADDALQNVFFKLDKLDRKGFVPDDKYKYINRVVTNELLHLKDSNVGIRKWINSKLYSFEDFKINHDDDHSNLLEDVIQAEATTYDIEKEILLQQIEEEVETLPEQTKYVIKKRAEGMLYKDIAKLRNRTENSTKHLGMLGIKRLKNKLTKETL